MLMLLTKEFGNLKGRGGRAAGVEGDGRGEVFRGEKGSLTHDEPPLFSSMALGMRMPGLNYRNGRLPLFPRRVLY